MKAKILLICLNIFIVLFFIFTNTKDDTIFCGKYASTTNNNENKIDISDEHQYKILVYYPETEYDVLNKEITKNIDDYINEFKNDIKGVDVQLNQFYTLNIFYNSYSYKNYISYVFHTDYYTGGAHPNHDIWTITYDKSKNTIIDIDNLIKNNPDILNTLSSIIRKELLHNKNIVNTNMMIEGTSPTIENFSNFAFSKDGLIIFFEYYQVAPYSSGEFQVKIPYDKLKL